MVETFPDLEEKYDSFYVPTFEIDVEGGATFSTAEGQASSVKVSTGIEAKNRVTFTVSGVFDRKAGDFEGLAESGLTVGSDLSVELGYGSETKLVMTGVITDVKPSFPEGDQPTVDVVGQDYRDVMDRSTSDASWDDSEIESIVETVAKGYGFRSVEVGEKGPSAESTSELRLKQLIQDAKSDLGILKKFADEFDYEMYSSAGVLRFRRPKKDGDPVAKLTYGKSLRSFRVSESSGKADVGSVKHKGVNHYTGETVEGESKRSEDGDEEVLKKAAMESDEEARQRSQSKSTEIDRGGQSTATTIGLPDLEIGEWVELVGLGCIGNRSFNGKYYILAADHDVGGSGYTTTVTLAGPTETNK